MEKDDFDWEDYINTAGMGPRLLPVQATELLGGIGSTMLRSLLVAAPGDIPEEYACSSEEAAVALACCELAELPAWDETALIDAATVGGNEEERVMWGHESREQLARRISLVMKAEKAPQVMSPADGVLLLRRAGINVFHQLLDAVAWLQLGSDATLPNYRLLKGIAEPQQTAPAQSPATPAPVVTESASGGVEPDKAGPLPLTTNEIANCFSGFRDWDVKRWKRELGSPDNWLRDCQHSKGTRGRGGHESTWWPVKIALALASQDQKSARHLPARFKRLEQLKPWLEELENNIPESSGIP